jgi:hypothetical protein
MADSKLLTVQTADAVAPITNQCDALRAASRSRKVNNLASAAEEESLAKELAARGVQETIGHAKVTKALLGGGDVDGADGSSPAKKAKTEKDYESMYNDLVLKFQVVLEFVVKFQQVPGAGAYFQPGVAPPIALDSAEINFTKGRASRRAPHCSFSHRFSSTTSRRTTARARRRPARTRSLKRVATPPPSHMCARRL